MLGGFVIAGGLGSGLLSDTVRLTAGFEVGLRDTRTFLSMR